MLNVNGSISEALKILLQVTMVLLERITLRGSKKSSIIYKFWGLKLPNRTEMCLVILQVQCLEWQEKLQLVRKPVLVHGNMKTFMPWMTRNFIRIYK